MRAWLPFTQSTCGPTQSSRATAGGTAGCPLLRWDVRSHGRLVVATADGELDLATTPSLAEGLSPGVTAGNHVVLDVTRLTFCSAAGLGLFTTLHRHTEATGGSLRLVAPSAALRRVLDLVALDEVLLTAPDITSAVRLALTGRNAAAETGLVMRSPLPGPPAR
ncbi:STAS domain-containing protein [Prauserella alba]|uniref:Anti-sigma factor antagonist n=1 Tax=Prauserella alba TaxID=176898 RepID=A0ABP4FZJ9_9PSEU|nr:STAS domain-containing protein [Prauserella alba]MCP2182616.1 anti-anti-sigma factor [Prauserella alba]